jgi:peptide-methionine (S)-S-oxide reductase
MYRPEDRRMNLTSSLSTCSRRAVASAGLGAVLMALAPPAAALAAVPAIPPPAEDLPAGSATAATAVFAGGCFWGVQGVFQHVVGVTQAVSGYAGGSAARANYLDVGTGETGHAESVRVEYDPRRISYGHLLRIFFSVAHDPTELNRQGPDVGTQYRSTVFAANADQARVAARYIEQIDRARVFGRKLATTVESLKAFHPAEAYHQDFLTRHPNHPYIVYNDLPKVVQLQRAFPADYAAQPVLVGTAGKSSP